MKKFIAFVALLSIGLVLSTSSVTANTVSLSGTNNTTAESLTGTTNTFSLAISSTLTLNGSVAALTLNGNNPSTDSVTNLGTIDQTGSAQAIVDAGGHNTITITNGSSTNSAATIETSNADAIHLDHATNNVTLNNYGSILSFNSSDGGNQAVDWNGITDGATPGEGSNTLNNYSTGLIQATESDAVRPGVDGFVYNSGTIKSTTTTGSSSDGIDLQTNSGVSITNAAGLGTGGANLIEGARHGIAGGAEVNTSDSDYDEPFVMTVTNNVGGTIQGDNGSGINLDGVDATEVVTVYNYGTITGDGITRDGDGIDVDGILNLTNTGSIISKNADNDLSEGVTVGGGTIVNSGKIEGSAAVGGGTAYARGITLAGIDHLTANNSSEVETDYSIPIQSIYGTTSVTNNSGGLIEGDTESGITVLGTTATAGHGFTVTITNASGATIEGSNTGVSEDTVLTGTIESGDTGELSGGSLNQAVIELDDANETYVVNESGTITQNTTATGTAIAMHGSSSTGIANYLNITGNAAQVTGSISGDTSADSQLTINPGTGNSFSYGYNISNFTVKINSDGTNGTVTLSGANTYSGSTTVSGGKLYVNNTTGSGTGSGNVSVSSGATLAGSGTISGAVTSSGTIASGAAQGTGYAGSTNNNGKVNQTVPGTGGGTGGGLTLGSTLGINAGTSLTFALGSGNSTGSTFTDPNTNSTYLTANGGNGSVTFGTGSTIDINLVDLAATSSSSDTLQLRNQSAYLLMTTGSTLSADLAYNLVTTGGYDANGYVLGIDANAAPGQVQGSTQSYETNSFALAVLDPSNGNDITTSQNYYGLKLYLYDGDLEVVPEPSTTSMLILAVLGGFAFAWKRKKSLKA